MKTDEIKITPKWSKSKEEVWDELFSTLDEVKAPPRVKHLSFWRYAAAAVIAMIMTGSAFAYLYTTTETTARGKHVVVLLPDGSSVTLNAESQLRYKPYWWFASRDVELTGEAYFEVNRGSRFTVQSGDKEVRVLGTSFNVFARPEAYRVTCLTGRVEVSTQREATLLTPNMQAVWHNNQLKVSQTDTATQSIGWTQNRFSFIGVPLSDVVKEIERQYDIQVVTSSSLEYHYTGHFSKEKEPAEVLQIIGKPFSITFSIKPE